MKTINNFVIKVPLAEVFIDGVSQGFHNEFTCRNLQLAVKNNELKNVKFIYNDNEFCISSDGKIEKHLKGFYDIGYELVKKLIFD